MKTQFGILALANIMAGGGCTQDVITESDELARIKPHVRSKEVPLNQAVILKPEDQSGSPEMLPMSSSLCEGAYVLQLRRISSVTGTVNIRVFTKDYDDSDWSAVVNTINFNNLSTVTWNSVLLFDATDEICFSSTDNIAFIQPVDQTQDIEFEARWYNVSGGLNTTPETIQWDMGERYYYSMYPDDPNDCFTQNPDFCCEYEFIATHAGSSSEASTMRFLSSWDNAQVSLDVPPQDDAPFESENCGPIAVTWYTTDHESIGGSGEANFECDDIPYQWEISETNGVHGVIFDPDGRLCNLRY